MTRTRKVLIRVTDEDYERESAMPRRPATGKPEIDSDAGPRAKRRTWSEHRASLLADDARDALYAGQPIDESLVHMLVDDWNQAILNQAVQQLRAAHPMLGARRVRSAVKWCARSLTVEKFNRYLRGNDPACHRFLMDNAVPAFVPPCRGLPGSEERREYDRWVKDQRRREPAYRLREGGKRLRRSVRGS